MESLSTWYSRVSGKEIYHIKIGPRFEQIEKLILATAAQPFHLFLCQLLILTSPVFPGHWPFTVSEVQESERYLTIVPWSAGSLVCPQEPSPSTASSPAAEEYWHFIDTLLSFYWHFINILLSAAPHTLWLDSCRAETGSDPSGLSRQPRDSLPCSKQSQRF